MEGGEMNEYYLRPKTNAGLLLGSLSALVFMLSFSGLFYHSFIKFNIVGVAMCVLTPIWYLFSLPPSR